MKMARLSVAVVVLGILLIGGVSYSVFDNAQQRKSTPGIVVPVPPLTEDVTVGNIVAAINQERLKVGMEPVKENALLTRAAQARAQQILDTKIFTHYDKNENILFVPILDAEGYRRIKGSENLSAGYTNLTGIVKGWMNSKLHRENLLKPDWTETGVGVIRADGVTIEFEPIPGGVPMGNGHNVILQGYIVVQLFGQPL